MDKWMKFFLLLSLDLNLTVLNLELDEEDYTSEDLVSETDQKSIKEFLFEEFKYPKIKRKKKMEKAFDVERYCKSFPTCSSCVQSTNFSCGWCHDFGCTSEPTTLCPYAKVIPYRNSTSCPKILYNGHILIPVGVRMNLKVKINLLDPALYRKDITCQIRLKERVTNLRGFLISDFVHCYPVTIYGLIEDRGTFRLLWGGPVPYSNEIPVFVYRCDLLAYNYENCQSLAAHFRCGWCKSTLTCTVADKCEKNIL